MKTSEVAFWIAEQIESIGSSIGCSEPYTVEQLEFIKIPCAQLKILYNFINYFDIMIDSSIYDKYKKIILIDF